MGHQYDEQEEKHITNKKREQEGINMFVSSSELKNHRISRSSVGELSSDAIETGSGDAMGA